MYKVQLIGLQLLKKLYTITCIRALDTVPACDSNANSASMTIYDDLISEKPCMIARFGANELNCLCNYMGVKKNRNEWWKYITGASSPWWWNTNIIHKMHVNAGFFPPTIDMVERFCELMLADMQYIDILGSWLNQELLFEKELENVKRVNFELLNPFFSKLPWTRALEGKKVLVVHPFAKTIQQQYKRKELLFLNNLLPEFTLYTLKAVQSIAGSKTGFADWFEAFEYMKREMDKIPYDICLIGAGAYGFSLAAHAKKVGKKGFHLGGSLQLLFGIRGKRWENENYNSTYSYADLMNEHWIKPCKEDIPVNANVIEDGCYW